MASCQRGTLPPRAPLCLQKEGASAASGRHGEPFGHVFVSTARPRLCDLALRLPSLFREPLPLLLRGRPGAVALSEEQCGCLLLHAFFCSMPHRNAETEVRAAPQTAHTRATARRTRACGLTVAFWAAGQARPSCAEIRTQ